MADGPFDGAGHGGRPFDQAGEIEGYGVPFGFITGCEQQAIPRAV